MKLSVIRTDKYAVPYNFNVDCKHLDLTADLDDKLVTNCLTYMHLNIRSLLAHFDYFKLLLSQFKEGNLIHDTCYYITGLETTVTNSR